MVANPWVGVSSVELWTRDLVPLKICYVEGLMRIKIPKAQNPRIGKKRKFGEWYWARTCDKASHYQIPIPLGYRGHHTTSNDNGDHVALMGSTEIQSQGIVEPPSLEEVIEAISTLKDNKAPGPDAIPPELASYSSAVHMEGGLHSKRHVEPRSKR
ncbi:hypothetical protein TNCV_2505401 [Trichonephila clavipes]|uniref:Uncharacterized protein n=1 Tax=Trichonephila clavipes TaxID=2585209 RepID=A0A8X6WFS3_TRICX|nr:hypothetical protein TNCV_2505401 [Trichonephila clavipes]